MNKYKFKKMLSCSIIGMFEILFLNMCKEKNIFYHSYDVLLIQINIKYLC